MTTPTASLATPYRSHTCGELRASDAGTAARLSGWVHRRRDHGQLIFLDLRDRHGITQVVIDEADAPEAHEVASDVRSEFVIRVDGDGRAAAARGPRTPSSPTGEIELRATASRSWPTPRRRRSPSTSRTRRRRDAPAQVPLPRPPARADGRPAGPAQPDGPGDPRRPPCARLRRGRDADRSSSRRPRARATSSSRRASSRATSTRCRRARSSSSSC